MSIEPHTTIICYYSIKLGLTHKEQLNMDKPNQIMTVKRFNLLGKLSKTGLIKLYPLKEWRKIPNEQIEQLLRTGNSRRVIK